MTPAHYMLGIEPLDAMDKWMTHEQLCGFLRGNVIKYIARYPVKGGVDDLRKARYYLDKLIEVMNDPG